MVHVIRMKMRAVSRTWRPVTGVRPNTHAYSDQLVQTWPFAVLTQVGMPVLNMPEKGINRFQPHMKFGRASCDYASDYGCHCDVESVPVRNPLFDSGKVTWHSFQCLAACLWTNEGHTAVSLGGNSAGWLLGTRDICVSHIGYTCSLSCGWSFGC